MTWGTNRNTNNESGQISLKKYNSEITVCHKELPVSLFFFFIILMLAYKAQLKRDPCLLFFERACKCYVGIVYYADKRLLNKFNDSYSNEFSKNIFNNGI